MNPEVMRGLAAMFWLFVVCSIAAIILLHVDGNR